MIWQHAQTQGPCKETVSAISGEVLDGICLYVMIHSMTVVIVSEQRWTPYGHRKFAMILYHYNFFTVVLGHWRWSYDRGRGPQLHICKLAVS